MDGSPPVPPTYPLDLRAGIVKGLHLSQMSEASASSLVSD